MSNITRVEHTRQASVLATKQLLDKFLAEQNYEANTVVQQNQSDYFLASIKQEL